MTFAESKQSPLEVDHQHKGALRVDHRQGLLVFQPRRHHRQWTLLPEQNCRL